MTKRQPFSRRQVWTEERVGQLRQWWADGYTASQIVKAFDADFTRNAIIGKAHRLGLTRRSHQMRAPKSSTKVRVVPAVVRSGGRAAKRLVKPQRRSHTVKKQEAERPVETLLITPVDPVSFFEIKSHQCHYPVGDWEVPIARKFFCGAPAKAGSSFCSGHHAVCWIRAARPKLLRVAA